MSFEQKRRVEVEITGHVQSRKEFERFLVHHVSDQNGLKYRGIVHHPNGRMEWQWCKTLKEAKQWVKSTIGKYESAD